MKIKKIGICDLSISTIMEWKSPRKCDILGENTIFDRKYLQKRAIDNMDSNTFGYESILKILQGIQNNLSLGGFVNL